MNTLNTAAQSNLQIKRHGNSINFPIAKKKPAIPEGIAGFFEGEAWIQTYARGKIDNPGPMHVTSIPFSNLNLDCSMFQFINQ